MTRILTFGLSESTGAADEYCAWEIAPARKGLDRPKMMALRLQLAAAGEIVSKQKARPHFFGYQCVFRCLDFVT
jgi:hypothetical protein